MRYAQITQEGICFADSYLSGEVIAEDMIPLKKEEVSPLGKKYVDGEWQELEKEPIVLPPSDTELLMQSMADLELAILEGGKKNV